MPGPGRRCVLAFELRNATLYTFGWPPSAPPSAVGLGVQATSACQGPATAALVVESPPPPPPTASPPPPLPEAPALLDTVAPTPVAAKPTYNKDAHADGENNPPATARPGAVAIVGSGVVVGGSGVPMGMDDAALALGLAKLITALVFGSATVWMGVVCVARGQQAQRRGGAGGVFGGLLATTPTQSELTVENHELHETTTVGELRRSGKPLMEELVEL